MRVEVLTGAPLEAVLEDVAQLRITVFRDWPYLYDGDLDYEKNHIQSYRDSPDAVVVGAFDGDRLVGAATGTPMEDHAGDFAAPFADTGERLEDIFYCAESVLLPDYRGRGIGHRFFDLREDHARRLGRRKAAFCGVMRQEDHPMRPADYRALDAFWTKRGYAKLPGVIARFHWKDVGDDEMSEKPLQFWMRPL
ncbi:MAG: GNAT family N-acetyltransferase [Thalassovita sp.]|nr:GNAT family N-acetyltransferase [Thalassovita sp.]